LAVLPEVFSHRRPQEQESRDELVAELYRQIDQLKVEMEWLKKISKAPLELKRVEVDGGVRMLERKSISADGRATKLWDMILNNCWIPD